MRKIRARRKTANFAAPQNQWLIADCNRNETRNSAGWFQELKPSEHRRTNHDATPSANESRRSAAWKRTRRAGRLAHFRHVDWNTLAVALQRVVQFRLRWTAC
jgi:hypothetical protein